MQKVNIVGVIVETPKGCTKISYLYGIPIYLGTTDSETVKKCREYFDGVQDQLAELAKIHMQHELDNGI